jgi:hypothetical protein
MAARTVRQGTADCPQPCRGLSGLSRGPSVKAIRTTRIDPRKTDRPRRPGRSSARATDRPLLKLGPSANRLQRKYKTKPDQNETKQEHEERPTKAPRGLSAGPSQTVHATRTELKNSPTSEVNSPKSSSDFLNGRSCRDKGLGTWKESHKDAIAQKSCLLTP